MIWLVSFLALYLLMFTLYPVMYVRTRRGVPVLHVPEGFVYSYQIHLHTQFSYDSLGKPEDVKRAKEEEDLDFVIITDHDNDHVKAFCTDGMLAGVERKITDQEGRILGDILECGPLKVIAHPFKEKYRWRLERDKSYLLELVNLKDALLEKKKTLFVFFPIIILLYMLNRKLALNWLRRLVDLKTLAERYVSQGWENKVLGGLDHHVKLYIREVGIRFLFPSYKDSFYMMRNYLFIPFRVQNAEDFPKAINEGITIISFCGKPSLVWREDNRVFVSLPYDDALIFVEGTSFKEFFEGSSVELSYTGRCVVYAYRYTLKIWRLYFGLKPLFVTVVE